LGFDTTALSLARLQQSCEPMTRRIQHYLIGACNVTTSIPTQTARRGSQFVET
jgi:hypothetical protein